MVRYRPRSAPRRRRHDLHYGIVDRSVSSLTKTGPARTRRSSQVTPPCYALNCMAKRWVKFGSFRFAILFALVTAAICFGIDVDKLPKPTGYVSDFAHVVDEASKQQLEDFSSAVEQQ